MKDVIEQLKKMNSKLDILIALQMVEEKPRMLKEKIKLLHELGAETSEIASILRIKRTHAAKERSILRRKKK